MLLRAGDYEQAITSSLESAANDNNLRFKTDYRRINCDKA